VGFRFATNLIAAIAGGLLVVAAFAFKPSTAAWIGLGAGCASVVLALAGFAARRRGAGARAVDLMLALAGAWTIVASCVFGAPASKWLAFADGTLIWSLGVLGLIVHEALTERELRAPYWRYESSDGEVTVPAMERTAA
jgi:hypothetical protein